MSVLATTSLGVDVSDGTLKAVLLARRGRRVSLLRAWRVGYGHEPDPVQGGLGALAKETRWQAGRASVDWGQGVSADCRRTRHLRSGELTSRDREER